MIHADKHIFSLTGDFTALLDRAATESVPPFRDDKASDQLTHRNAQVRGSWKLLSHLEGRKDSL